MLLLNLILIKIAFGGFPSYDFLISSLLKLFFIALLRISGKIAPVFFFVCLFVFYGLASFGYSPPPPPPPLQKKKKDVFPESLDI